MKLSARGAVLERARADLALRPIKLEPPRPDEIVVRIAGTGICATDLDVIDGEIPITRPVLLGHEGAGVVEAVGGRIGALTPGDHVVLSFECCGTCRFCRLGAPSYCEDAWPRNFSGTRMDGSPGACAGGVAIGGRYFGQSSFATRVLATERNAVRVARDLPLALLGPFGCAFQTGAGAALNVLGARPGHRLAVIGAGPVGLAAVMAAHAAGVTSLVVVDRRADRLALAAELGATATVDADREDVREALRGLNPAGYDGILEITGQPELLALAVELLAPLGTAGLIGGAPDGTTAPIDVNALLFGRTVRGIVQGGVVSHSFIPALLDLHRAGRFPFERLITTYAFDDINVAIRDVRAGAVLKAVILMPSEGEAA